MVVVSLAEFTVKQGKLERVLDLVQILTRHAEDKEPGTLVYVPTQDSKDKHKIKIWEEYESEEAYAHHMAEQPFQTFKAEVEDNIEGGLKGVSLLALDKLKIERS